MKLAKLRWAGAIVAILFVLAGWYGYSALFNRIMEPVDSVHINVQELNGAHPLRIAIYVDPADGASIVRSVTTKRDGTTITVLYHLALAGLTNQALVWGQPYILTVPDRVGRVQFGRGSRVIWERTVNGSSPR